MSYRYYVHHIDRDTAAAFTAEQRAHEYRMLPNVLSNLARGSGVTVSCAPNDADQHGVVVGLACDGSEEQARSLLATWLDGLNARIPGLNFVLEPADPPPSLS